jgi:hypothetical protein
MDFAIWRERLRDGLGHEAAIPWSEPCRLTGPARDAVGRMALTCSTLLSVAAGWHESLARTAGSEDEAAALRELRAVYDGHAASLRRLARLLLGDRIWWLLPDRLPLPPLVGRATLLLTLHAAGVFSRVWLQAVIDAVRHDPLVSSVFAAMLYERTFIVSYARGQLVRAAERHALVRLELQWLHGGLIPALVTGGWLLMGRDFRLVTGWDWQTLVGRCHQAYEQAYSGDLGHLRQRGPWRALGRLRL